MYILGITGWPDLGHDAAAALIRNDEIVAAAEEERFIRTKHAYGKLPLNSARYCLRHAGIGLDDVDFVAVYWNLPYHYRLRGIDPPFDLASAARHLFPRTLFKYSKLPKIRFLDHHLCHAASSFRLSGFTESAVLVVDGAGEDVSTSIWYGDGNSIKLIRRFGIASSLGYFYKAATAHVGLRSDEPGKSMALAAYGTEPPRPCFFKLTKKGYSRDSHATIKLGLNGQLDEDQQLRDSWKRLIQSRFGPPNVGYNWFTTSRTSRQFVSSCEFMCAVQSTLERILVHLVKVAVKETDSRNLCMAGGVALNCAANRAVLNSRQVERLFIQPAANDAGCSLGAAMELRAQLGYVSKSTMNHAYLGPALGNEVEDTLDKMRIKSSVAGDPESLCAELIADGNIVGWFQGRMEFGPRALGNRSILADPRHMKTKQRLDLEIKFREPFRPYGATILDTWVNDYLVAPARSPFMLLNFEIIEGKRKEVPAIVHVDGTTRPQILDKGTNPKFWRLIEEFSSLTGVPMVLNTSLNVKREPIACGWKDALKAFLSSNMDFLIVGNRIIEKERQAQVS